MTIHSICHKQRFWRVGTWFTSQKTRPRRPCGMPLPAYFPERTPQWSEVTVLISNCTSTCTLYVRIGLHALSCVSSRSALWENQYPEKSLGPRLWNKSVPLNITYYLDTSTSFCYSHVTLNGTWWCLWLRVILWASVYTLMTGVNIGAFDVTMKGTSCGVSKSGLAANLMPITPWITAYSVLKAHISLCPIIWTLKFTGLDDKNCCVIM